MGFRLVPRLSGCRRDKDCASAFPIKAEALRRRGSDNGFRNPVDQPACRFGILVDPLPEALIGIVDQRQKLPFGNHVRDPVPKVITDDRARRIVAAGMKQHGVAGL